ncbi:MAG: short-chain dehydrogenase [Hyphomonas sp.]|uniref:SDR family NAD(P)-dependent oxidoreductase n=1 Tax=Hyphomonas sp. TaxID=87 RepID=UPI001DF6972D|nr:SDR family oxidoreductase [Hyphomonas sp.]MBA4081908.1 short-chain dehydrogenase [Erythrobacter sp.]MBA4228714.1 short-chain dehydrogenase [Hyphomonas sp.]
MTGRLEGRVAIVTGAAGGIGAASARRLAAEGSRVVLGDIDADAAAAAAQDIEGALALPLDLTDENSVRELAQQVVTDLGRIDILHNNAAIQNDAQRQADLDVMNLDVAAWDRAMAVNVRGAMLMSKYVLPHMIEGGRGSIIHSASGFGVQGESTLTAYGSSKAALIQLNRMIATQYGKLGVRSNCMVIGFVLTSLATQSTPPVVKDILLSHHLTPRLGEPEDIANLVAFLASDESEFITGAAIPIDGGVTAHQPSYADFQKMFAEMGSGKL